MTKEKYFIFLDNFIVPLSVCHSFIAIKVVFHTVDIVTLYATP